MYTQLTSSFTEYTPPGALTISPTLARNSTYLLCFPDHTPVDLLSILIEVQHLPLTLTHPNITGTSSTDTLAMSGFINLEEHMLRVYGSSFFRRLFVPFH